MTYLRNEQLAQLWHDYATALLIGAGLLGLLLLTGLLVYAKAKHKPVRRGVLSFAMNMALLINAEGMWDFVTGRAHFPVPFALFTFAVFEVCYIASTSQAAERYAATTERDANGKVTKPGHPGKMLWIAFSIAAFSGTVVATTADYRGVAIFRLGLPLMIFGMWWAALTAEGQIRRRGRFAFSPYRVAVRRGWIVADDEDDPFAKNAHINAVRKIVIYGDRLRGGTPPAWLWEWLLRRLARVASQSVVDEALAQLERSDRVMVQIAPGRISARRSAGLPAGQTAGAAVQPAGQVAAGVLPSGQTGEQNSDEAWSGHDANDGAGPLFEARAEGGGQEAAAAESDPADKPVTPADVRADAANAHAVSASVETVAGTWPLAQRGSPTADGEATDRPGVPKPEYLRADDPRWRPAVEQLAAEVAAELRPGDGHLVGRGLRELVAVLASRVPQLDPAQVRAFLEDWWLALAAEPPQSGLPWSDLLPQVRAEVGSPEWQAAVERLSAALSATLRPEDLRGQSGRGAIQLAAELGPQVPELDSETVVAFIGDNALALSGQPPVSGLPWQQFLPTAQLTGAQSDDDLLRVYGEGLRRELAEKGKLTRYRVEQVTRAGGRQAERLLDAINREERSSLSAGVR